MRVSEMVKLIKSIGCYVIREGSNHQIWYSPLTGKEFSIPRN